MHMRAIFVLTAGGIVWSWRLARKVRKGRIRARNAGGLEPPPLRL